MKTPLEMIETWQTVCKLSLLRRVFACDRRAIYTIHQKSRTLMVEVSRSVGGLPDKFGTQVNILADDEDIKFYNQGFL